MMASKFVAGSSRFLFLAIAALCFAAIGVNAAIMNSCVSAGMFAMTFDDGPAQYTNQLLDILAQKNVKVTFHFVTQYLTDPTVLATIQRAASEGHYIGLRSETTWNLMTMSSEEITSEVKRTANVMAEFTNVVPKVIRLPYKGYDDRVRLAVEAAGVTITEQSMDSYDYTGDAAKIYNAFKIALSLYADGKGKFISIQHDGVQGSVATTPQIIDLILSKNYRLVKLDECVGTSSGDGGSGGGGGGGSGGGGSGGNNNGGGSTGGGGSSNGSGNGSKNASNAGQNIAASFPEILGMSFVLIMSLFF
jgi:peptidoglycan/xylan/chitin deacetylase (PgdA/CDA1 family)